MPQNLTMLFLSDGIEFPAPAPPIVAVQRQEIERRMT